MAVKTTRKYKLKDVEMLTSSATIIDNAIANKTVLQSKRSTWTDAFFNDLKSQIESTTENFLGKDAAKEMREATQIVVSLQAKAQNDLSEFKTQIAQDFKKTPAKKDEILNTLGFAAHYKKVKTGDQEALVQLLYQFKTNIVPALSTEIVEKGIAQATIDAIVGYANTLKQANITQEGKKGTRKETTEEAIVAFNNIYDQVISFATIARNLYKTEKTKQDLFSFSKVSATMNSKSTTSSTTAKKA